MTNAEHMAREVAFDILRAYHVEIKTPVAYSASAAERERAQAGAIAVAEKYVRRAFNMPRSKKFLEWLDEQNEENKL